MAKRLGTLIVIVSAICAAVWGTGVTVAGRQAAATPRDYVKISGPLLVLAHARVIDGTGSPARDNQTLIIRDGRIAAVGAASAVPLPSGEEKPDIIDLTGRTVFPGLVMVHEHLYYPTTPFGATGPGVYGQLGLSFSRLYLAGGVTTLRTAGNTNGFMDINLSRRIAAGELPGPAIDATAPYLNGPSPFLQMAALRGPDDARKQVEYWADEGATSFKAYMQITRDELRAAINAAHARRLEVTGHLCSVTYGEAADLGIDNLEHGFFPATDFVPDKQPDVCPGQARGQQTVAALDENGPAFKALVQKLVAKHVALTSTLTVFETFARGRPTPPGLDVLVPQLRESFMRAYDRAQQNTQSVYTALLPKDMSLERAFVKAGGMLTAGTDPTGAGGVVPGFSNQRQLELLVEAGFSPVEAISIGTLNGAKLLGRADKVGSIVVGKQADLVVVLGDPSRTIGDVRRVETVFKAGVGYDPQKLVDSVRGQVGLW